MGVEIIAQPSDFRPRTGIWQVEVLFNFRLLQIRGAMHDWRSPPLAVISDPLVNGMTSAHLCGVAPPIIPRGRVRL